MTSVVSRPSAIQNKCPIVYGRFYIPTAYNPTAKSIDPAKLGNLTEYLGLGQIGKIDFH